MMMVPQGIDKYQDALRYCISSKAVSMKRIDDAVKRILAVKIAMGLVKIKGEPEISRKKSEILPETSLGTPVQDALLAA